DPEALRALTHEVMIRTRRSSVVDDLALPPRRPRHPEVKLTRAEADLYQRTTAFLRRLYREGFIQPAEQEEVEDEPRRRKPTKKGILQLAVMHLRQRLCSSSRALAESLAHLAESERISPEYRGIAQQLAKRAEGIKTHAKLDVLTKLLKETPDRLVVFSDHRPTIQLIDRKIKRFELVVGELDVILGEFGGAQQFEGRLAEEWLAAEGEEDFARRVETLGADIEKSSAVGKEQEQLNSLIAPDDNAMRLERRFETLSVPGRLRLGLGTSQVVKAAGWDAKRHKLAVHVTEVLEALESIEPIAGVTTQQPAGSHPEYGELVRLTGLTSGGRAVALVAQVDHLPLALVDIEVDAA